MRLKTQAFCYGSHHMGNCCAWPQEEDGDVVTDEESDYSTSDDMPESESSHSARGCLEDFQMYDRLEIGEPVWAELALPTTWPPCIAGLHQKKWRHALPATA